MKPKSVAAKEPSAASAAIKTEKEYIAHAEAWLDEIEDADELDQRWTAEKSMRNKANVSPDVREALLAKVKAKSEQLRGKK